MCVCVCSGVSACVCVCLREYICACVDEREKSKEKGIEKKREICNRNGGLNHLLKIFNDISVFLA